MYSHERHNRSAWDVGVAVTGIFVLFLALAAIPLALIPLHIPRDYNEEWIAYHSFAAITGSILYPPAHALTINNYPPLSFYLVGLFGQLDGSLRQLSVPRKPDMERYCGKSAGRTRDQGPNKHHNVLEQSLKVRARNATTCLPKAYRNPIS
jgi:hypothetical protein